MFTSEKHVFANLGDGTYFHSQQGDPPVCCLRRQHSYKLLYNDAVAMTGG
ncbi:MAG: hypothetical protein R3D34_14090 [Nitratireductor sp.]